ncbi:hypothetical protein KAX02_08065 [candidate division WOR-3 bacterium]|nr:hypothetical protein [candidate division WOR-3 bacterium]
MTIEEIQKRISEIEDRLLGVGVDIYLADRRLWDLRSRILSEGSRKAALTGWYRRYEREGLVEKAEEELKKLVETEKVYEALKDKRIEKYDERDSLLVDKEELEEELEELKRKIVPPLPPVEVPELIDIDDATGYLIMYSPAEKAYFKLRPEDYKEGKIKAERYFSTLEIAVNFTFDTEAASKYPDMPHRKLEAEVRIVARVREASRELSLVIPEKLKEAFERHITFFFEAGYDRRDAKGIRKASPWTGGIQHIIAKGIKYKGKHEVLTEVEHNIEVGKKISEALGIKVLKIGVFYRINDEKANFIIEEEYARPIVTGEWSRQNYSESISKEFNVEHELGQPLHWSMVRGFVGASGWKQLKYVKKTGKKLNKEVLKKLEEE